MGPNAAFCQIDIEGPRHARINIILGDIQFLLCCIVRWTACDEGMLLLIRLRRKAHVRQKQNPHASINQRGGGQNI